MNDIDHGRERKNSQTDWSRILMLATGALAIEVAFTVETGYAIPTLLKGGLHEGYTSIMWAFSPVLGILFQGYLGSASDRCKSSWGKRRPFILVLGLAVSFSLALFAYGRSIPDRLFHGSEMNVLLATIAIFVVMDFSLDQFEAPVRMYLLDSVSAADSDKANYIYSAMMALGSFTGSLISAVDWESLRVTGIESDEIVESTDLDFQVKVVFGITLFVFVICLVVTLRSVQEKRYSHRASVNSDLFKEFQALGSPLDDLSDFKPIQLSIENVSRTGSEGVKNGVMKLCADVQLPNGILHPHADGRILQGRFSPLQSNLQTGCCNIRDISESFHGIQEFLRYISYPTLLLWLTTFLGWFVYINMNIYFTDYVGEVVYGGSPTAADYELASLYNRGVRMAAWCRAIEDIVIFVYSLVLKWVSDYVGHRTLLIGGHILHLLALTVAIFEHSLFTMFLVSITCAIFVANLMSIPYALIPYYNVSGEEDVIMLGLGLVIMLSWDLIVLKV